MVEYTRTAPITVNAIWKSLREWDIEYSKVMSLTLDNASVNDACIPVLLSSLSQSSKLFYDKNKLSHVHCAPQIFNLIIHDGQSTIGVIIQSVRMSVKNVRRSPFLRQKIKVYIQQVSM